MHQFVTRTNHRFTSSPTRQLVLTASGAPLTRPTVYPTMTTNTYPSTSVTFVSGRFSGKFRSGGPPATARHRSSISILDGEIFSNIQGFSTRQRPHSPETHDGNSAFLRDFPEVVKLNVAFASGVTKTYLVRLQAPELRNIKILNEGNDEGFVEADITGQIIQQLHHRYPK